MILDQEYSENSIRTFTGKVFDIKILDPKSICIEDIAHALAFTPRFGGHLKEFYSVAQHSILVSNLLENTDQELAALLHDASEAYLGDVPSPIKKLLPDYKVLENNLSKVLAKKFKIKYPYHPLIKEADKNLLSLEWDSFFMNVGLLDYWTPEFAKAKFLEKFYQLNSKKL